MASSSDILAQSSGRECHVNDVRCADVTITLKGSIVSITGSHAPNRLPCHFSMKNVLNCEYFQSERKMIIKVRAHQQQTALNIEIHDSTKPHGQSLSEWCATFNFIHNDILDSDNHVFGEGRSTVAESSSRTSTTASTTSSTTKSHLQPVPGATRNSSRQIEALKEKESRGAKKPMDLSAYSGDLERVQNTLAENRANGSSQKPSSADTTTKKPPTDTSARPNHGLSTGQPARTQPVKPPPLVQASAHLTKPSQAPKPSNTMSDTQSTKLAPHTSASTASTRPLPDSLTSTTHRPSTTSSSSVTTSYTPSTLHLNDYSGIKNTGNTCYINATLQALMSLRPFISDLGHDRLTSLIGNVDLKTFYKAFLAIVDQTHDKDRKNALDPGRVKLAIARHAERFRDSSQQDAHEFLVSLLARLEMDLMPYLNEARRKQQFDALASKRAALKNKKLQRRRPNRKVQEEVEGETTAEETESEDEYGPHVDDGIPFSQRMTLLCPSKRNFAGVLEYTFKCEGCKVESSKQESIRCLTLDIFDNVEQLIEHLLSNQRGPSGAALDNEEELRHEIIRTYQFPLNIGNLMRIYFSDEIIERRCEKCNHNVTRLLRRFVQLPRVLVVHLKRFSYDAETVSFQKLAWKVAASPQLSVADWCARGVQTAGPIAFLSSDAEGTIHRSKSRIGALRAEQVKLEAMLKKEKEDRQKNRKPKPTRSIATATSSLLSNSTRPTSTSSSLASKHASPAPSRWQTSSPHKNGLNGPMQRLPTTSSRIGASSTSVSFSSAPSSTTTTTKSDRRTNDPDYDSLLAGTSFSHSNSSAAHVAIDLETSVEDVYPEPQQAQAIADDADIDDDFLHEPAFQAKKPKLAEVASDDVHGSADDGANGGGLGGGDFASVNRMDVTEEQHLQASLPSGSPERMDVDEPSNSPWAPKKNLKGGSARRGGLKGGMPPKKEQRYGSDNTFPESCDDTSSISAGPRSTGLSLHSGSNPDMDSSMADIGSMYSTNNASSEGVQRQLAEYKKAPSLKPKMTGMRSLDDEDDGPAAVDYDGMDIVEKNMWERAFRIANHLQVPLPESECLQTDLPKLAPGPAGPNTPKPRPPIPLTHSTHPPKTNAISNRPSSSSVTPAVSRAADPISLDDDDDDDEMKKAIAASMSDTGRKITAATIDDDEDETLQRILRDTTPTENIYNTLDFFDSDDEGSVTEMVRDEYEGDEIAPPAPSNSKPTKDPLRPPSSFQYALQSVVHHLGSSANSGHYIAQVCQNPAAALQPTVLRDPSNSVWKHYDDALVSSTTWEEVAKRSNTVYMLFYVHESAISKP